ncbi:glycosyl hydrolase [Biscogniauxia marginata]|nr:glycosyl hydrolase [Biscogniauxia marginata]
MPSTTIISRETAHAALNGALTRLFSFGGPAADMQYDDATLTLTSVGTPDPFVTRAGGRFYMTFTTGNRIEIWSSRSLVDIESSATKHVIWTPPPGTDHSADLWAPELHALRGRWYVYYAAAHPAHGNKSHRMYVLGGPRADEDPCHGQWEFLGRIHGTPPDQWAIDGTVFELDRAGAPELYLVYSGWPIDRHGNPVDRDSDLEQQLFIARLDDPTTISSSSSSPSVPVMISRPDQPWEITRDAEGRGHGINEGPQFLRAPDGSWAGLVYSCAGSWTPEYKMARLRYVRGDADPLDPASWRKGRAPLLVGGGCGPYGPGHGCFLDFDSGAAEGGREKVVVVAVYHATDSPADGWENRCARVRRVAFTGAGPFMGVGPSGERRRGGLVARLKAKVARLGLGPGLGLGHGRGGGSGSGRKGDQMSGVEGLRALLEGGGAADGGAGAGAREL